MKNKIKFAIDVLTGKPIETSIEDIIASRILWEGDSGSGKSHGMTTMIEGTDGKAQRIVIDIEGEYPPLKDEFDFVLVGRKTEQVKPNVELNLNDIYIEKLVEKLISKSVDTIIDLSEFPNDVNHFFVVFQKAIFKYAKLMKRPLIIFVDEAHVIAPEVGKGGKESEASTKALKELAKRGRKRGIGLVCGTQAIADFSKDVVRQLKTRFIGNCSLEADVKAATRYLGFGKDRESELRDLADEHHFFVVGPAVSIQGKKPKQVLRIKAIENKTKLYDFDFKKTLKLREKNPEKMKDIVAEFDDIPQVIDEELDQKERLQKENIDLKKQVQEQKVEIVKLGKQQPVIKNDAGTLNKTWKKGYDEAIANTKPIISDYEKTVKILEKYIIGIKSDASKIKQVLSEIEPKTGNLFALILETGPAGLPEIPTMLQLPKEAKLPISNRTDSIKTPNNIQIESNNIQNEVEGLSGPETRILTAVVQRENHEGTRTQIAVLAGYSPKGSAFKNPLSHLRSLGYIVYNGGDSVQATDNGIAVLGDYTPLPSDNKSIQQIWLSKISGPEQRILKPIIAAYPGTITREETAEQSGYSANGSAFKNPLSHLRSIGLVEYIDKENLKASKELFPE